jgi:hypothetical protein
MKQSVSVTKLYSFGDESASVCVEHSPTSLQLRLTGAAVGSPGTVVGCGEGLGVGRLLGTGVGFGVGAGVGAQ